MCITLIVAWGHYHGLQNCSVVLQPSTKVCAADARTKSRGVGTSILHRSWARMRAWLRTNWQTHRPKCPYSRGKWVVKSRNKTDCSPKKFAQLMRGPKAGAWAPTSFTDHEHGCEHDCAQIGKRIAQKRKECVLKDRNIHRKISAYFEICCVCFFSINLCVDMVNVSQLQIECCICVAFDSFLMSIFRLCLNVALLINCP